MLASVVLALVGLGLALAAMQAWAADTDIVISEVMYNAKNEGSNQGEWIEIYNKGGAAVDLTDWQIRDNTVTDTITTAMCPGGSCSIPSGECWLIAKSQTDLQDEFDNYTSPLSPTVDTSSTVFLGKRIGGGLANGEDNVILMNPSDGNVDCVSWANTAGNVCDLLTYVSGGNGADTSLDDAADGQSITNIQSTWYEHQTNGSPYNCTNTAEGGSPNAITIRSFSASTRPFAWPPAVLAGAAALAGLLWARQRQLV